MSDQFTDKEAKAAGDFLGTNVHVSSDNKYLIFKVSPKAGENDQRLVSDLNQLFTGDRKYLEFSSQGNGEVRINLHKIKTYYNEHPHAQAGELFEVAGAKEDPGIKEVKEVMGNDKDMKIQVAGGDDNSVKSSAQSVVRLAKSQQYAEQASTYFGVPFEDATIVSLSDKGVIEQSSIQFNAGTHANAKALYNILAKIRNTLKDPTITKADLGISYDTDPSASTIILHATQIAAYEKKHGEGSLWKALEPIKQQMREAVSDIVNNPLRSNPKETVEDYMKAAQSEKEKLSNAGHKITGGNGVTTTSSPAVPAAVGKSGHLG